MGEFRPADHAMGLELQLEEVIEQRERAIVQGRHEDVGGLALEIAALQDELAATSEQAALAGPQPEPVPELHYAEELSSPEPPH